MSLRPIRDIFWHYVEHRHVFLLTVRYQDGCCETMLPDGLTIDELCETVTPPAVVQQAQALLGGWLEFEAARRWRATGDGVSE